MPKKPPRKWLKHCIKGVEESGGATDPGAVCGSLWYHKMSKSEKERIVRQERRRK